MGAADGKAITRALADNVLNTRFEDLSAATVANAKDRILDIVGCAIGGARAPGNAGLIELVKHWGGKPEATVLGHGLKAPAHTVAMANSILCRSFDWGVLTLIIDGRRFPTHTSETTVMTALALGESRGVSGRELISALVVGDDLAARIWTASDRPQPGQGPGRGPGFEPWGTITTLAAAAIAGRLLGLDGPQLRNAFGIALNMIAGAGSGLWDGATMFKLSQGTSARSGVNAAQLARAGWTGLEDPLFGAHGSYYSSFAGCEHPERIIEGLGKVYHAEVVFKPYPGGRPTHAPIDAALALARKHEFDPDDIEEAVLRTSPPATAAHYAKPYKVGDYPTGDALFSYRYSVASALVRKHARNEDYDEEHIRDPKVQALIARTRLEGLDRPEGVELEVRLKDGRLLREYVPVALGEPSNPLSREGLAAKFMTQVEYSQTVSMSDAEKLLKLLARLEEVDDAGRLVELAVKRG
ncbi:MAG TPA: MmgE/PrpD family protein [Dehalococcoidia bacterium]